MTYAGFRPSASPLTAAQMAAGDARFPRLDGVNVSPDLWRNGFINPSFNHWQRGTAPVAGYGADRWLTINGGDGSVTMERLALAIGEASTESRFAARIKLTNRTTQNTVVFQRIENVKRFAGKRVRLSGLIRASAPATIIPYCEQYFGVGGSVNTYVNTPVSVNIGTVFAPFSMVFDVPSIAGKVIGTGNDFVGIGFFTGLTGTQTIDVTDLDVKEVVVGYGDQVPAFERVPQEIDLIRCQRYHQAINLTLYRANNGAAYAGGICSVRFPVEMRTAPTGSITSLSGVVTRNGSQVTPIASDVLYQCKANFGLIMWFAAAGGIGEYVDAILAMSAEL